jgi:hypothetical protein
VSLLSRDVYVVTRVSSVAVRLSGCTLGLDFKAATCLMLLAYSCALQ